VPLKTSELTADEALSSPAVQLFVERAAASSESFELSDCSPSALIGQNQRVEERRISGSS
jgi:hypothetical protein